MPFSPSHRYSKYIPVLFIAFDLIAINLSFFLANNIKFGLFVHSPFYLLQLIINVAWMIAFFSVKLNVIEREEILIDQINRVLAALVVNLSILFGIYFVTRPYYLSREHLFYTYLAFSLLIILWRVIWYVSIQYYRSKGFNYRNIVVVGKSDISDRIVSYFRSHPGYGYRFLGFFDDTSTNPEVIGKVEDLMEFAQKNQVDFIYTYLPKINDDQAKELIDFAENNLIKFKIISQFSRLGNRNFTIQKYGAIPVVNLSAIPLDNPVNQVIKRAFDIMFSSVVIIFILSWLIPIIGFLIKIESKGPIFFKQHRNGLNDKSFLIFKFRTMIIHEQKKVKQATKNDSRITKLGSFLRKSSIDELPQFINVFLGDMSVVGPRPHAVKHNEEFKKLIDRFIQRHAVKPGITGLAQARGYRGETPNFSDINGRVKLDRFYVKNWSMTLDLKIIAKTIESILKGNEKAF